MSFRDATLQKRRQNERKFGKWEDLPAGGRKYSCEVLGRNGWRARYVKIVGSEEETLSFYQEIYDNNGRLVEVHHKCPFDLGHTGAAEEE